MNDTQLAEATTEDQQKELLQQLINSFNPKDFMTPSQIEIAELSLEQLNNEYALVQSKPCLHCADAEGFASSVICAGGRGAGS